MPSSFRALMVAPMRLSCGSFWKPSAHSTIIAFSFSHTFGWAYEGHAEEQLCYSLLCFLQGSNRVNDLTEMLQIEVMFLQQFTFFTVWGSTYVTRYGWKVGIEEHTLLSTVRTSVANSLEHISKWNILPQFDTQAPINCKRRLNSCLYAGKRWFFNLIPPRKKDYSTTH